QQECALILLLGSVTDNVVRPTDLSREPSRHRSLSSGTTRKAVPQRPRRSSEAIHVGRCQREPRLENLCRFRAKPDSDRATALLRHGTGNRPRRDIVRIGLNNNRSLPFSVPMGSVPKSQSCNQASHVDGDSKLNPSIYRDNQRSGARYQSARCDHSRTWLIHGDGPRICGLRAFVSHPACACFLCNSLQRQSSIQSSLLACTRPHDRSTKRSDRSVDWSQKLIVLSRRAPP